MKTDEEYIRRIRQQYKRRKLAGGVLTLATILIGILTYLTYTKLNASTSLILETLQLQHVGDTVSLQDIEDVITNNKIAQSLSVKTGVIIGSAVTFIGFFIGYIFVLLFGMRKEQLLIKYYDKSKN